VRPFLKRLLIGAALLGLLVLFYLRTNRIVFAEHRRFDVSLDRLRELDAALNQDILKSRFHLLEDYDNFTSELNEFEQIAADPSIVPSYLSEDGQKAIRQKMDELLQLAQQKEELLERFKSQNAVLNNSLRYLPQAGAEMAERNATSDEKRDLEAALNELMRQTLVYSLLSSDDSLSGIREAAEKLGAWRAGHRDDPQDGALAHLAAHASSVVAHKPKVEALTRQLLSIPTHERLDELLAIYNDSFSQALHTVDLYRVALYMLCGFLALGIAYTVCALDAANARLEHRVAERTSELLTRNGELQAEIAERLRVEAEVERMNKTLVDVSRRAGMAEVATSVLHNVGNVLNSVNVSCSVISEAVRKSRVHNVAKTAALLQDHSSDLTEFFLHNPTGQKLPDFLRKLADQLFKEQTSVLDELQSLGRNIEHIREIVATQQSYAVVGGVQETLRIRDLVEDALNMNGVALARHGVEIIREYEALPPVSVDKHKVLQILVNLVRNAKHALTDGGRTDKRLIVRVASDDCQVKICVNDNGIGISPENLTRIFAHGFTTKKHGHGFGLHSGVLAAQEMGGRLSVQSDGLGTGATLVLEFPRTGARSRRPERDVRATVLLDPRGRKLDPRS